VTDVRTDSRADEVTPDGVASDPSRALGHPGPRMAAVDDWVGRVISTSRYFILLAILGSFIAGCLVLVFAWAAGIAEVYGDVVQPGLDPEGTKKISVEIISLVDLFLLGTVLFVVAIGLYQLFVDPRLPTPRWLIIADLDDLKERLLGTVIVLLAVSFLGYVVTWDGTFNLLGVGAAIGAVLVALSLLMGRFKGGGKHTSD